MKASQPARGKTNVPPRWSRKLSILEPTAAKGKRGVLLHVQEGVEQDKPVIVHISPKIPEQPQQKWGGQDQGNPMSLLILPDRPAPVQDPVSTQQQHQSDRQQRHEAGHQGGSQADSPGPCAGGLSQEMMKGCQRQDPE